MTAAEISFAFLKEVLATEDQQQSIHLGIEELSSKQFT